MRNNSFETNLKAGRYDGTWPRFSMQESNMKTFMLIIRIKLQPESGGIQTGLIN